MVKVDFYQRKTIEQYMNSAIQFGDIEWSGTHFSLKADALGDQLKRAETEQECREWISEIHNMVSGEREICGVSPPSRVCCLVL